MSERVVFKVVLLLTCVGLIFSKYVFAHVELSVSDRYFAFALCRRGAAKVQNKPNSENKHYCVAKHIFFTIFMMERNCSTVKIEQNKI
jgi:hypothetical protein